MEVPSSTPDAAQDSQTLTTVGLLAGIVKDPPPSCLDQIEHTLAQPDFDWSRFLRQASEHGLIPLLYRHLVARPRLRVPRAVQDALTREFQHYALSRFPPARRLRELLCELENAGVDALPYKGPVLAIELYGHYAARHYGDLDILVRPEQLPAAVELFQAIGLRERKPLPDQWRRVYERNRHHYQWIDPQTGTLIELHWSLSDRFWGWGRSVEWFFEQAVEVDLLGEPVASMAPERSFLALCLHGARGRWERLGWLVDLSKLVANQPHLDWARIFEQAEIRGFRRQLYITLHLLRRELNVSLPEPWAQQISGDSTALELAESISMDLHDDRNEGFGRLGRLRFGWRSGDNVRARWRFIWALATDLSDNDLQPTRLPAHFDFLRWVRRPFRLISNSIMEHWRRRSRV